MGTFDAFDIPRYSCVPNMPPPQRLSAIFIHTPPLYFEKNVCHFSGPQSKKTGKTEK